MGAATALADGISRALGVPRPFAHEANAALTLVQDWRTLARQVTELPVTVKPVGYYRSPESVDIWKIYRRYRQFQQYVSSSAELLAGVVVPRLSQAYLKIFYAKQCKDRLVELHAWLAGVVENTQRYFQALRETDPERVDALFAALWQPPQSDGSFAKQAMPALWLCAFLFAGANSPFPHYFRGLPAFAHALEEVNIELAQAPIFPSKLRSSIETRAGLGLRLTPSRELDGAYVGATVSGFLRGASELDPNLVKVQVGARLVRVNGADVADEPFDAVLSRLRAAALPLRLRFLYNPHWHRRERAKSVYVGELGASGYADIGSPRRQRLSSIASTAASSPSFGGAQELKTRSRSSVASSSALSLSVAAPASSTSAPTARSRHAPERRFSVDSRKSLGILSAVFGDLFGRRRHETADDALLLEGDDDDDPAAALASWDDVGGETRDVASRGFFSLLPPRLLHELRARERLLDDESELKPSDRDTGVGGSSAAAKPEQQQQQKTTALGVWSTSTGALGLALGACRLRGVEAAMLELPPQLFSARPSALGSEKLWGKGFVLVAVNNESTFGRPFAAVVRMLAKASRPTSVCFRWFQDWSPFLETDAGEQQQAPPLFYKPAFAAYALECLSEAQADLCSHLHLALVENASVRNEIGALQHAQRESRRQQEKAEAAAAAAEAQAAAADAAVAQLRAALSASEAAVTRAGDRLQAADAQLASTKREFRAQLAAAHESAKLQVAAHEERLVRESNRSIATARALAERRAAQALETALDALQQQHATYLQQLAEEHAEEVESLAQQVVVWRHQVEVLTEAEKRSYAAMLSSGVHPYHDAHRSRFGLADAPRGGERERVAASARASAGTGAGNGGKGSARQIGHPNPPSHASPFEYESWRDGTPEDPSDHTFSELSDRSSLALGPNSSSSSNATRSNATLWDRVMALIAD
ncbi:hypothetical protein PybrP1_005603 [[Pythium] brassicae (nom. inval.)]|nr:hypothetical protein PybrP1_005603 [[Pythium] brassicae (nom. inval.)]